MTEKTISNWNKPELTVAGQLAFWNGMSNLYEKADMTVDNRCEIEEVIKLCQKNKFTEVITLGGAIGCRDPKMILESLESQKDFNGDFPNIIFNDLSPNQLKTAEKVVLKPFIDKGVVMKFVPGEIIEVCPQFEKGSRQLVLGVYGSKSFFEAYPEKGYPTCGFDEYIKNYDILGEEFILNWVKFDPTTADKISDDNQDIRISHLNKQEEKTFVKNGLRARLDKAMEEEHPSLLGLQIIGQHSKKRGFFLSHWYFPQSFEKILESVFPPDQFQIETSYFAKGMLYKITRKGKNPTGLVTVLNNVLGNILPKQQVKTLEAIREII